MLSPHRQNLVSEILQATMIGQYTRRIAGLFADTAIGAVCDVLPCQPMKAFRWLVFFLMLAFNTDAVAQTKTFSITPTSSSTCTTDGDLPTGYSAAYSSTYNTNFQLTSNNSMTFTVSAGTGAVKYGISKIVLNMRSNKSGGAGRLFYKIGNGDNQYIIGSNSTGINFNNDSWHGSWSTTYVDVTKNVNIEVDKATFALTIAATANSLYCDKITITYEEISSDLASPTISGTNPFTGSQDISISCETTGAAIYYTTDGSTPSASSVLYNAPFSISATTTVSAIAIKDGNSSSVSTATFTRAKAAVPTFTPNGGTYSSDQNVNIHCGTAGATIHYTIDGSTPDASSPTYSTTLSITASCTLKAIATHSDYDNSDVASATFTIEKPVTVTFNAHGITANPAPVTETAYQAGVVLPDLNIDCSNWTFSGWATSAITSQTNDAPKLFTAGSTYKPCDNNNITALHAVFKKNNGEEISVYRRVETDLNADWAGEYLIAYSSSIIANGKVGGSSTGGIGALNNNVDPSDNLSDDEKSINADWGDKYKITLEEVSSGSNTYVLKTQDGNYNYHSSNNNGIAISTIKGTAAAYPITVEFTSEDDIKLKLGGNATGAAFRYNTNGYFRYYKNCGQQPVYLYKKVSIQPYLYSSTPDCTLPSQCGTPVFTPAAGTYTSDQTVTITCATNGAEIHYTTDGAEPTAADAEYSAPISVSRNMTIKAIAVKAGTDNSDVATSEYVRKVATPQIEPEASAFIDSQEITLYCEGGATLRYTTDGTTPNEASTLYSAPFTITANTTVKAIAFKSGCAESDVETRTFTLKTGETFEKVTLANYTDIFEGDKVIYVGTKDNITHYALMTTTKSAGSNVYLKTYDITDEIFGNRIVTSASDIYFTPLYDYREDATRFFFKDYNNQTKALQAYSGNSACQMNNSSWAQLYFLNNYMYCSTNVNGTTINKGLGIYTDNTDWGFYPNPSTHNTSKNQNFAFYVKRTDDKIYCRTYAGSHSGAGFSIFESDYGTVSAAQCFFVKGRYLSADINVSGPAGYEFSENEEGPYSPTLTLAATDGRAATRRLYVRLSSTAESGSRNEVLTFTSATDIKTMPVSCDVKCNMPTTQFANATYSGTRTTASVEIPFAIENNNSEGNITKKHVTRNGSAVADATFSIDLTKNTFVVSASGVYTVTLIQAANGPLCPKELQCTVTVESLDQFVDLVNGYETYYKGDGGVFGSQYSAPAQWELNAGSGADNACHATKRYLIGWIEESKLQVASGNNAVANNTGFLDPNNANIIQPGQKISPSGKTYYAIWGVKE